MVRRGAAASGQSHVHATQWQQVRGLVVDGVRLSRARLQSRRGGGYAAMDAGAAAARPAGGEPRSSSSRKKAARKEPGGEGRGARPSPRKKASKELGEEASADPKGDAQAEPPAPKGRWVHVSA